MALVVSQSKCFEVVEVVAVVVVVLRRWWLLVARSVAWGVTKVYIIFGDASSIV